MDNKNAWKVEPKLIDRFLNVLDDNGFKWFTGRRMNEIKLWDDNDIVLFIEKLPKRITLMEYSVYQEQSDEEFNITEVTEELLQSMKNKDAVTNIVYDSPVNCPSHDNYGGLETIDIIKMLLTYEEYCGYLKGSFLKYRERAPYKGNTQQDYEKAKWYFDELMKVGSLSSVCFYSDNFDECDNITHEY